MHSTFRDIPRKAEAESPGTRLAPVPLHKGHRSLAHRRHRGKVNIGQIRTPLAESSLATGRHRHGVPVPRCAVARCYESTPAATRRPARKYDTAARPEATRRRGLKEFDRVVSRFRGMNDWCAPGPSEIHPKGRPISFGACGARPLNLMSAPASSQWTSSMHKWPNFKKRPPSL